MADTMPPASDTATKARRRVGAYAKLLGNYASDDALIEAGEAAELLFVRGLAFCSTSDADGYITHAQVVRYVGAGMRDAAKRAERLADVGVWERHDGGYLVRSWTKIHETSEQKGRRRKQDRERKVIPLGIQTESETTPDGILKTVGSEYVSLIQGTTEHDTTEQVVGSLEGERPEILRPIPDSKLPTCSTHPNGDYDGPCGGCMRVRESRDKAEQRTKTDAVERAKNCRVCEGMGFVLDDDKNPTRRKCEHRRSA